MTVTVQIIDLTSLTYNDAVYHYIYLMYWFRVSNSDTELLTTQPSLLFLPLL